MYTFTTTLIAGIASMAFSKKVKKDKLDTQLGKKLQQESYERSIILTNSFKSALLPYFAKIKVRTGWLGEFRYGLINDIRSSNELKKSLMVEKFAALSFEKENFSLENLSTRCE